MRPDFHAKTAPAFMVVALIVIVPTAVRSQTSKRNVANVQSAPGEIRLAPNADAQAAARYVWDRLVTKCGESWVYNGSTLRAADGKEDEVEKSIEYFRHTGARSPDDLVDPLIYEYKGVTFQLIPESLSPADKLNGLEWRGIARLSSTVWRMGDSRVRSLGNWQDTYTGPSRALGPERGGYLNVYMKRLRGRWLYSELIMGPDGIPAEELGSFKKLSCDALQKMK